MKDVVIVSGCRTAIGTFGGTLRDLNGAILAGMADIILAGGTELCPVFPIG
jgi:acetyl-CoA acetyltransferase